MLNEDKIIQNLRTKSQEFIGDDAAILPSLVGEQYVISKDLLLENVHFRINYFSPHDLAHKALHVNLSDLAAMGAKPLYILCGISIPKKLETYAKDFLKYLTETCEALGIILIGGDTTFSDTDLFISITAIGKLPAHEIKYRKNAQKDDLICIAGNLGWAHVGFTALENNIHIEAKYINCFLRPTAKLGEGRWLAQKKSVTSMMDISDGLYIDLKRLCKASGKGAVIDLDLLLKYQEPPLTIKIMLEGGEDYGLLFTVNEKEFANLSAYFLKVFSYGIKSIGYITDNQEIQFLEGGKRIELNIKPFSHFGECNEI